MPPEPATDQEQRYGAGRDQRPQRGMQPDQQHHHGGVRHQVEHQEQQAEGEEPADHRQVAGDPREQLPGLPPVVEAGRQPLQVGVDVGADRRLHAHRRRGLRPPADEDQQRLGQAEQQGQAAEPDQAGRVVPGDRAVDHPLHHERHGEARAGAGQRRRQQPAELDGVRAQVGAEPPEVAQRASAVGRLGRVAVALGRHFPTVASNGTAAAVNFQHVLRHVWTLPALGPDRFGRARRAHRPAGASWASSHRFTSSPQR